MMPRGSAGIVLALALVVLAAAPQPSAVRVWTASIQLPTYAEGPANPNPPFDLFTREKFNYPYPIRDALTDRRENKSVEDQGYIHGDGVLMYPGDERLHPDQDRGIAGPIGTVQLANFRRGLQDHQYLSMARGLGLNSVVDDVLNAIVPRVFSAAGDRVSFPETGAPYESARFRLGRAIAAAAGR